MAFAGALHMTAIEWSFETVVGLLALVVFLLTADYDAAGHALKRAGCKVAHVVTIGAFECAKPAKIDGASGRD